MKILSVIRPLFETLLMEANLINGTEPYNGISLTSFLEPFSAGLNTTAVQQAFTKKMSRLLMADERFQYAVRELPQNAPPWAQQAFEKGELVFFQPSEELKDTVENISHYLASLEQDLTSEDKNVKAIASRELQGFPKTETLDLIVSKVQEYFSRGAASNEAKAASDTEGMKAVLETPGGYIWYRLEAPKAFYREGQTLKNCIGRNYTAENTKASGTTIYVLRDKANNSVVATRIIEREMQEVKGKNNQPPIPRYMPAVQKLINSFNITLARGGISDVGNSGYYFYKGILYSKPQAIAKLLKVDKMFSIPNTDVHVGKVVSENSELIASLYLGNNYWYGAELPQFYEARTSDDDPIVTVQVIGDGTAQKVIRMVKPVSRVTEAEELGNTEPVHVLPAMILKLIDLGKIKKLDRQVIRDIYWQDGAMWDESTKTFSYRTAASSSQYKPKQKGSHTLDVYEGQEAQQLVRQMQTVSEALRDTDPAAVQNVYTAVVRQATEEVGKETDKVLIVVEFKDKTTALYSARGSELDITNAGYTRVGARWSSEYVRDGKTATTLVALANDKGFNLPKRFQVAHGLSYREGTYVPLPELTPVEIPGQPPAVAFNLATLDPMDKATVMARALSVNDTKPHVSPFTSEFKFRGVTRGLDQVLAGHPKDQYFHASSKGVQDKDVPTVTDKSISDWTEQALGTAKPTAIYRVSISYGADKGGKVSMVAAGKGITHIDAETLDHTWQSRDDYQKVCDQLNKFADDHELKFERSSTKKSPQLRVGRDGKLIPAEALAKSRMEKRLDKVKGTAGRVDVIPFADGATAKKMSQEDYGTWSAHGIKKNVAGVPWEITDADDNVIAIVVVTRDGKMSRIFSNPTGTPGASRTFEVNGRDLPIISGIDAESMTYIKKLASEFGWTEGENQFTLTPNSTMGKMLRQAYRRHSNLIYLRRVYSNVPGEGIATYVKGKQYYNYGMPLQTAGLVRIRDGDERAHTDTMTLTQKGQDIARRLAGGENISWSSITPDAAPLSDEYSHPEAPPPEERQVAQPREAGERAPRTRLAGGGTKSEMALQKFRDLTDENDGTMPTRAEFIALLLQPPFNMTSAGASTYQYNTKAKYLRERGDLNEHFTFKDFLLYIV